MLQKTSFLLSLFVVSQLSFNVVANENQEAKTDILFLKIQELESEIADLRNKIESQNYLIEKLINESISENQEPADNIENLALNSDIRFKGIEDPKSKDQIYSAATDALEEQNFDKAYTWYHQSAQSGNVKALMNLGLMYLTGKGTNKDIVKAHKFLTISEILDYQDAKQNRLIIENEMSDDQIAESLKEVTQWFRKKREGDI